MAVSSLLSMPFASSVSYSAIVSPVAGLVVVIMGKGALLFGSHPNNRCPSAPFRLEPPEAEIPDLSDHTIIIH